MRGRQALPAAERGPLGGYDAISDFLGYDYPEEEDKETTESQMDETYDQMPEDEFQRYLEAYGIH